MNYYIQALKNYFNFEGRATRKEFWMFVLINFFVFLAVDIIDGLLGMGGNLWLLYELAILIPSIAISVRRLHDIGKSGWWILIGLIPLLGLLILLYFYVLGSDCDNKYGSNKYGKKCDEKTTEKVEK